MSHLNVEFKARLELLILSKIIVIMFSITGKEKIRSEEKFIIRNLQSVVMVLTVDHEMVIRRL